jgi:hypothetical protein
VAVRFGLKKDYPLVRISFIRDRLADTAQLLAQPKSLPGNRSGNFAVVSVLRI